MKGVSFKNWLRFVVGYPYNVILAVGLITLFFAWQIPNLRFETSIYDLTIENLSETIAYQSFKKEFGSEEVILVVVRTDNVFDPETFERIDGLAGRLSEIEGVRRVLSLPGIKRDMDVTDKWTLEEFVDAVRPVALIDKNILSQDHKTTAISLILEDGRDKTSVIRAVQEEIDRETAPRSIYQIGMPIVSKALADYTQRDFLTLPPITFGLIVLVLFLFFRNFRGIFIPAGSVSIALIWTFGLMSLTGTPLSMLTMVVPIFLIAVGTAYCMYIFPEYLSAIKLFESPKDTSYQAFLRIALPTSLAVMTTSIGLGSLLVNKISAIRQFALFSCFGIISMLIIILSFLPALTALLPYPKQRMQGTPAVKSLFDRVLTRIVNLNLNHQKITLPIIGAIALIGIVGITRVQIETNPVGFFKEDTPVSQRFHDIYRDMAGSFPINVVLNGGEDDFFENPEHLRTIQETQTFLETLEGVDKTISFADYLKLIQYANNKYAPEAYALPEEGFEVRMAINNFKAMLGDDVLKTFMSENFSKANIMLRTHIASSEAFLSAQKKIEQYLTENLPESYTFQVTGFGIVISQSSRLITEGQIKSLSITLVLIFAIMFLLFLSWKVGFIGILPNCFPIIVNFGLMGWAGIPLSMATSLIAGIAIGLAVDDTIHYLVRYNVEFKKNLDKEAALRETIMRLGKPIIFTTVTVSIGFSVLMGSSFKPTSTFGLLMVITMFSALVADLVLLPSLMLHVELVTVWDLLRLKLGKDPQEGIPLFDGLSKTQIHYTLLAGSIKEYRGGEVVFRKGEVSDSMYAVISGELDVFDEAVSANPDAPVTTKQLVNQLKTGDVFGEMGMIRACERSATVVATRPVELLEINERMLKRLTWLYPPAAHRFFFNLMRGICDRLEHVTNRLVEASIVDSQSGLYTRSFFTEMLEKEISRCRRHGSPLYLAIMDMDNLRDITNVHGHLAGSLLLSETGRLLQENCQRSDLLCRFDGERFGLMMSCTSPEEAADFCERFREALAEFPLELEEDAVRITASFGVCGFHSERHRTPDELVADAVAALEEAKGEGGNRVKINDK